ncbi:helix-turn-helix domain-containing protein, partial [Novosphingobium sp. Leaf2]|uniref:helix-turn-helix domain-containing protein n=1 Tax=Novosphingobium sp. Leaf2 TaxID=1735670 RepID=UPI0012E27986
MDWNAIVGANVRRLRVACDLTQEQLAHDSDIDVTYLRGIEASRRNPSVAVIGRLARVRTHKQDSQQRRDMIHHPPARRYGGWRISSG